MFVIFNMKDFYYILGIDANCTSGDIKEAYRKLSKKFHPDLNQNDKYFESRFREIQEAYEILSDPSKRSQYDHDLNRFRAGNFYQSSGRQNNPPPNQPPRSSVIHRSRLGIDISFTIVLIAITIIFGLYVKKAVSTSKTDKVSSATPSTVSTVALSPVKHHKRKHLIKIKNADLFPIVSSVSIKPALPAPSIAKKTDTRPIPPAIVTNKSIVNNQPVPVTPKAIAYTPPAQAAPLVIKSTNPGPSFLYVTNIRSNITGITNLKQSAGYNSSVIKAIPVNSKVFVLEKGNAYYKVRFNNIIGYVPKWTVAEE